MSSYFIPYLIHNNTPYYIYILQAAGEQTHNALPERTATSRIGRWDFEKIIILRYHAVGQAHHLSYSGWCQANSCAFQNTVTGFSIQRLPKRCTKTSHIPEPNILLFVKSYAFYRKEHSFLR